MTYKVEYPGKIAFLINNGVVKDSPGILQRLIICRAPNTNGYLDFHDGIDASAPILMTMTLDMTESISIQPISIECGFEFHHGLYITFNNGLDAEIAIIFS